MKEKRLINLSSLKPKDLAIFCGAGISKNSGLPSAGELALYILKKILINKKNISEIIIQKNSEIILQIPFEEFIEILYRGSDVSNILSIFENGKPNSNHILFARLAKNGYLKTIFTTNFDLLFEKALRNEGLIKDKDFKVYSDESQFSGLDFGNLDDRLIRIFKIHGSIDNRDSIRTTIEKIAKKEFFDKRVNIIKYLFSNGQHKKILILGYSCSDEFDITPEIQRIKTSQKEIVFIEHSNEEKLVEDIKRKDWRNPFKSFQGKRIICNTDSLIKEIWDSYKNNIGEYNFIKSKIDWEIHVNDWVKELKNNREYRKNFIIGSLFNEISNFNKAIQYHEKSLLSAIAIGNKIGEEANYNSLGNAYQSLGDFKKVIEYNNKSLEIAKAIGNKIGKAECYTSLGNAYLALGDFKKAIQYQEKSLLIAKASRNKIKESDCHNSLGYAYESLGDFKKAIKYFEQSLEISKVLGNKSAESNCYIGLGIAYRDLGDFKKAIQYYKQSLEISKVLGNKSAQSNCYTSLGSTFYKLKNFKKAVQYYEQSLEIAKVLGCKIEESVCYGNLGNTYLALGDFKKAIQYQEKSLLIAKALGSRAIEAKCYINLGYSYNKLKDFKMVIEYNLKAENILKQIRQFQLLRKIYNNLFLAYKEIEDIQNSEDYKNKKNKLESNRFFKV